MVLLHELAHVRRWDNLINLLQRIIESLLFFHPAVWLLSNWVRREREACCDALVVARTNHPHAYAELLVALAAQMPRSVLFHPAASSAMAAGPLRSRIRRILGLDDDPMLISGKSFTLILAGLITAATLAILYLPKVGQAEPPATEATKMDPTEARSVSKGTTDSKSEGSRSTTENTESTETKEATSADSRNAATDDWPAGIVFPSPKEGEISKRTWRQLRIKVVPATTEEQAAYKRKLKVIGGVTDALKTIIRQRPFFLESIGGIQIENFDQLDGALKRVQQHAPAIVTNVNGRDSVVIKLVYATDRGLQSVEIAAPLPSGPAKERASKFPSLEQQKLADLAYKRLGLELEPIGEADLKRVKALGYDGGVKVSAGMRGVSGGGGGGFGGGGGGGGEVIQPNDILVGLGVWPTTNMKSVAEILSRGDLGQLNPLKFYVVRHVEGGAAYTKSGETPAAMSSSRAAFQSTSMRCHINPPRRCLTPYHRRRK